MSTSRDLEHLERYFPADFHDKRIGQVTYLPESSNRENAGHELFAQFHSKTRNMIRKGLSQDFEFSHEESAEIVSTLHHIHSANISGLGGRPKKSSFFKSIPNFFTYNEDYRVYVARQKGVVVSVLLVFYFRDYVEYFTPATREEYRSRQPLSALIFLAMRDAVVERGSRRWNWGGTWLGQHGVYAFKSKWGTTDFPYRYHTRIFRSNMRALPNSCGELQSNLSNWYPDFYVLPYARLGDVFASDTERRG